MGLITRRSRPTRIADGQGVLRTYDELLAMIQHQLCTDGVEQRRVIVDGHERPALNWRADRIKDITVLIESLSKFDFPYTARRRVINQLICLQHQLRVLNWPDREDELRRQLDGVISRLRHTTRQPGVPTKIRSKLKPANRIPAPRRRA